MPDSVGTALRLKAIQIITVAGGGMSDSGSLNEETAAALFGKTQGFSIEDPNVKIIANDVEEDSDF